MDLVVGVACCCALRSLAASFGCSPVSEAMKDRGARGIEQRFESRNGGGYDANVYFEAVARMNLVSAEL